MIGKVEINVYTNGEPHGTVSRIAILIGPFAVHRPTSIVSRNGSPFLPRVGWSVNHLASGRNTTPRPLCCFSHAKSLATALVDSGIDWSFGELPSYSTEKPHAVFPPELSADMERAKRIIYSHRRECCKCAGEGLLGMSA